MQKIAQILHRQPHIKVIFIDLFDTLLHRTVHPNYVFKLWAKFLIRELGFELSVDELYAIRADSLMYLSKVQGLKKTEVNYEDLVLEVYKRLVNCNILLNIPFEHFKTVFASAEFRSETSVQFKNNDLILDLVNLKEKGYPIYLISDFHLSHETVVQLLTYHGFDSIFKEVFVSCAVGKSKERGNLYPYVLEKTGQDANNVLMIGDHKISDIQNALAHGIQTNYLPHFSHKFRNKRNLFGTDSKKFKKTVKNIEDRCRKSSYPFSEYIIHFYFFTERLYKRAQKDGVKNLFFLAREGLFLKQLFDEYQTMNQFPEGHKISTYYLKASRQSAMLIALKPLTEEAFTPLLKRYKNMSLEHFLGLLAFSR